MVILLLVALRIIGGPKLSAKLEFPYGHTVTCCMETISRSEIVHQIGISVRSFGGQ
jgi:hypothetical protein